MKHDMKYMRKNSITFYDWCINTNNTYLLKLWDYEKNDEGPNEVSIGTARQYWFKCPKEIHESELYTINNITGDKHQKVECRKCHSFGQWCVDNNQTELLDRWDYEKNNKDPFEVSVYSGKKYYFLCPNRNPLHPSELKIIGNLVQQEGSRICTGCNSFAQWCIDNVDSDFLEKYWSDKNMINPFTITPCHTGKVWIKCQQIEYHGDYAIDPFNFIKGKRCSYCSGKIVHQFDSLANVVPISIEKWSDKNDKTPYDYTPYSNKSVWIKCDIHGDHLEKICDFTKNEGVCQMCLTESNFSKLQNKVSKYIHSLGYDCLHEYRCNIVPRNPKTGYLLPFDNEISDLKLIIEVHGSQHYEINIFTYLSAKDHNVTPEEELKYQKWKDQYKKEYAISQGYEYLEIPYWYDDKNQTYKKVIDEKISYIKEKSLL